MKSGLLWFDGSQKPITSKIEDAARRYQEKFGRLPDTCFVNPRDFDNDTRGKLAWQDKQNLKINIASKATIMPNHIWLGISK